MSYPEMVVYEASIKRKSNAIDTAVNLAGVAASYAGYAILQPVSLKRLMFFVTVQATTGTTNAIVNWQSYPTYASSSGAITLGTITIPNGATVGKIYYKDISDSTRLAAGSELALALQVAGTDGGTAQGSGWMGFIWEPAPDADANNTLLVKSS